MTIEYPDIRINEEVYTELRRSSEHYSFHSHHNAPELE